ncbi:MAG: response regulator [Planctomycetota bacterium]
MCKIRILVVDDEADTLKLYRRLLRVDDAEIETESSARQAAERLRTEHWDLLICDIYMPQLDGFEVMKIGRTSLPELRCIAVTGRGTEKVLRKVLTEDCFGYVNKPFDWDYLNLLVRKALRPQSGRS